MEVKIEQLNSSKEVYRTFTRHPSNKRELEAILHGITYAYCLESTRVTVNGKEIKLYR